MIAAILDHLWQSTIFALAAGLTVLTLGRYRAYIRYRIWFAASVKFLIPVSLLTEAIGWLHIGSVQSVISPGTILAVTQVSKPFMLAPVLSAPVSSVSDTILLIFAVWATGAVTVLLFWFARWELLREMVGEALPMAIAAPIPVKATTAPIEPGLVGIWRPVILLPEGIFKRLRPEELYGVLAHELCHLERRDNITAAVHMLVEALFWFHPIVWWIGKHMVEERERACDENVIEHGNSPQAYAQSILKICQHYVRNSLACVPGVSGADLKRRVEYIMADVPAIQLGTGRGVLVGALLSATILVPFSGGLMAAPNSVQQIDKQQEAAILAAYQQHVDWLKTHAQRYDGLEFITLLKAHQPLTQLATRFGAFRSISYKGRSKEGWDVYDVDFENARAEWRVAPAGDGAAKQ